MVGNLFDPADGRVHFARDNNEPLSRRPPVLTRCDRNPAPDVRYDVDGPISCDDCLALGLGEDVWAALHEWTARNGGRQPRPGSLDIGHHTYAVMMRSRALFDLFGPRLSFDGPGMAPLFGFPVREVDEDTVLSDGWALVDADGAVVGSGVLG